MGLNLGQCADFVNWFTEVTYVMVNQFTIYYTTHMRDIIYFITSIISVIIFDYEVKLL